MVFLRKKTLIFIVLLLVLGCESRTSYDIGADKAVSDLSLRIQSLEEDLNTLDNELDEVKKVLNDKDIDVELRKSIKKEVHEGEKYRKEIDQWISYLKVKRKQRHASLIHRKGDPELSKAAQKEVEEYFIQKKLKPIDRPWLKRYRTAIEL